jgi:hypothetical protein
VSPRTLTAPPTDRRYWRRLLRAVHPDAGGDGDLFVWVRELQDHVAGDHPEPPPRHARRDPPRHHTTGERVDFTEAYNRYEGFYDLTVAALRLADTVPEVYGRLLRLLGDCVEAGPSDVTGYRAQHHGASYKQLAYIGHRVGMTKAERAQWYSIAETVPLSQRHAGHILSKLQRAAA